MGVKSTITLTRLEAEDKLKESLASLIIDELSNEVLEELLEVLADSKCDNFYIMRDKKSDYRKNKNCAD